MAETSIIDAPALGGFGPTGIEPRLGGKEKVATLESLADELLLVRNKMNEIASKESQHTIRENRTGIRGKVAKMWRSSERSRNMTYLDFLQLKERDLLRSGTEILLQKPGIYALRNVHFDIGYPNQENQIIKANYYTDVKGVVFSASRNLPNLTIRNANTENDQIIISDKEEASIALSTNQNQKVYLRVDDNTDNDERAGRITIEWHPHLDSAFRNIQPDFSEIGSFEDLRRTSGHDIPSRYL